MANELTQKQINKLVAEYKKHYDGDEEVTEEKVLKDLKESSRNLHVIEIYRKVHLVACY